MNSIVSVSPSAFLRRPPAPTVQPASSRSFEAWRIAARSVRSGLLTGGDVGGLGEDLGRQLVAELLEQRELLALGQAGGRHRRVLPEAVGALVEAVEERRVRPFEVEHQRDRLADARVLELLAAEVHPEALGAGGPVVGDAPRA